MELYSNADLANFEVNGLDGHFFNCPGMDAEYSFYVKSIASYAPTFLGYNNSVLAIVMQL